MEKALRVIESCVTLEQLAGAARYVLLREKQYGYNAILDIAMSLRYGKLLSK